MYALGAECNVRIPINAGVWRVLRCRRTQPVGIRRQVWCCQRRGRDCLILLPAAFKHYDHHFRQQLLQVQLSFDSCVRGREQI
jgi:hypothetical protein